MMTFLGVPILDWVLLVVLLGFGVEAWLTCRTSDDESGDSSAPAPATERPDSVEVAVEPHRDQPSQQ